MYNKGNVKYICHFGEFVGILGYTEKGTRVNLPEEATMEISGVSPLASTLSERPRTNHITHVHVLEEVRPL